MTPAEDETRKRLRMPSGPNPLGGEQWVITRTVKQVVNLEDVLPRCPEAVAMAEFAVRAKKLYER